MRFDDRLATVLDQPAVDAHGRAVQWRQLVELVARGTGQGSAVLRDRALQRIAQLMDEVPATVLAATARAIAAPSVPAELVALFAARGAPAVAALLTTAELEPAGWAAVRAVAAPDVLPLLAALHPEQAEEPMEATENMPLSAPVSAPAAPLSPPPTVQEPAPPPAGLFRWECGPTGEIDWVEGAPRAALIGRSLTEPFTDRFAARLPFSDEPLVLTEEGSLAGEWRWSGTPAFFPDTGRFAGYRGIARREGAEPTPAAPPALPEHDDLRELMHELRTPLNAIIGFGEIIEGQYLGPAHRSYRERAGEIVRQARRLNDAVDALDLSAKLRSGRFVGEPTCGLEELRPTLEQLREQAEQRGIGLTVVDRVSPDRLNLPAQLAERLLRQFAGSLLEAAQAGESLRFTVERQSKQLAFALARPGALGGMGEEQLTGAEAPRGARFALRLVQGLAAMLGGKLDLDSEQPTLLLPLVG